MKNCILEINFLNKDRRKKFSNNKRRLRLSILKNNPTNFFFSFLPAFLLSAKGGKQKLLMLTRNTMNAVAALSSGFWFLEISLKTKAFLLFSSCRVSPSRTQSLGPTPTSVPEKWASHKEYLLSVLQEKIKLPQAPWRAATHCSA